MSTPWDRLSTALFGSTKKARHRERVVEELPAAVVAFKRKHPNLAIVIVSAADTDNSNVSSSNGSNSSTDNGVDGSDSKNNGGASVGNNYLLSNDAETRISRTDESSLRKSTSSSISSSSSSSSSSSYCTSSSFESVVVDETNIDQARVIDSRTGKVVWYTMAEVSRHRTKADLWVVVNGNVYDMSAFAPMHPGGVHLLAGMAGKDATREFVQHYHKWKMCAGSLYPFLVGHLQTR